MPDHPFSKRVLVFAALVAGLALPQTAHAAPAIPGFDRLSGQEDAKALAGEILIGELNCIACHAAEAPVIARLSPKAAPDLNAVGSRVTPQYLREFLSGTHAAKPGTTMPDLLHAKDEEVRRDAVDSLVHFLASKGGPVEAPRKGGSERLVEQGRELFHSVGCVACHAPETGSKEFSSPVVPLANLAKKTTVDQLAAFLLDPQKIRKSGRMPNLWLGDHEARAISVYLLREQLTPAGEAAVASKREGGVEWQYFEAPMGDKLPNFEKLTPTKSGEFSRITFNMGFPKAKQDFAIRWRATLHIPKDGEWTFFTVSDDGSQLLLNGEVVVDNDGVHGSQEKAGKVTLKAGDHDLEVRYFQKVTGAIFGVGWQGPGFRKQRIPSTALFLPKGDPMLPLDPEEFVLDRDKAAKGATAFTAMRCTSCHEVAGAAKPETSVAFADLTPDGEGGCLSATPADGRPHFHLSETQRKAIGAALADRGSLTKPLEPGAQIHRTFAAMNCYACHERDGAGGPDDVRRELFKTKIAIDLGEEGKIPPNLNSAGSKLRPAALEKILYHGELHVRGRYMATRMPGFGKANLEALTAALIQADAQPGDATTPEFNYGSARDGQALVGTSGVSCIICHNVAGKSGSGVPGIDLATVHERLNPGWFNRFLQNPQAFNKDTRMPNFWPAGKAVFEKIAEGDTTKQVHGIWNYLSLGKSMPPPPGIAEEGGSGTELKPVLEPIVHRTFMTDVGPRAITAGFPERIHIAFDANVVRLAKAWRGRFFDSSGVASGRTDKFFGPLGTDVIDMPPGPAFALLESSAAPWPKAEKLDRDVGGKFGGYRYTERGEPIFLYQIGGVEIQEHTSPDLKPGGALLARRFTVKAGGAAEAAGLTFLAAQGSEIEERGDGVWVVDKKLEISVDPESGMTPSVREVDGSRQLVIPVEIAPGEEKKFQIRIQW